MASIQDLIASDIVVFFSKPECHYCDQLEADLKSLKIPFKKLMLESDIRDSLIELTKCKTVPQLFIGGKFIGGYREFSTLCGTGKISQLLEPYGINADIDF